MNTISINIPQTQNINEILKLSNEQIKNVVELGYIAYLGTVDNLYQINNEKLKIKLII